MGNQAIDIKGQTFGKLATLRLVSKKRRDAIGLQHGAHWLCRCECGRYKIARARLLKSGNVKSCGCLQQGRRYYEGMDIAGQRYGLLVAIERTGTGLSATGQGAIWKFKCDCGTEKDVRLKDVRYGNTLSCGCLRSPQCRSSSQSLITDRPWSVVTPQ